MERFSNNIERKFDNWEDEDSIYRNEQEVVLSVSPIELEKALSLFSKYLEKKEAIPESEQVEVSNQIKALVADVKIKYSMSSIDLRQILLFDLLEGISVGEDSVTSIDLPGGEFENFIESF